MRSSNSDIDIVESAIAVLDRLRVRRPRVHCITNAVAQTYTANLLLAAGAVPSMTIAVDEVTGFVAGADALLVNVGTLDHERRLAIGIAIDVAAERDIPWLLDPVFVDRSPPRLEFVKALLAMRPTGLRLNEAEFAALDEEANGPAPVEHFARAARTVVALTGETDLVSDGDRLARLANGHPWMSRITAMGCAGAALVAACLAVEPDPWRAAASGLLMLGVAAEIAAAQAQGPGSLAVALLDALHRLGAADLRRLAKVS